MGKVFLCMMVVCWVIDEGLCIDVCIGGELVVVFVVGVVLCLFGFYGNNKLVVEFECVVEVGVGMIVVDSVIEIEWFVVIIVCIGVI